jgi:hypothetical protein
MPHACTEDQFVEQPAIGLFAELGWLVAMPHPHPAHLPEGEGVCVTVSEKGFRRICSRRLVWIPGREPAGAEEQIHNLRWIGHTPKK